MKEYSLIYRNINIIHLIPCLAKPFTWSDLKTNVKCTSVLNHKQFFTFLQLLVICQPVSFCSFRQSFISLLQKCRSQDLRSQRLINKSVSSSVPHLCLSGHLCHLEETEESWVSLFWLQVTWEQLIQMMFLSEPEVTSWAESGHLGTHLTMYFKKFH